MQDVPLSAMGQTRRARRALGAVAVLADRIRAAGGIRGVVRRVAEVESRLLRELLVPRSAAERLDDVTVLRNLVTKEAVGAIVTLRIPDLLAGGAACVDELAVAAATHPNALRRVVAHLVERGILLEDGTGRVRLSETGELLRSDHPERRALFFEPGAAVARLEHSLSGMLHSLRTGEPAYAKIHGRAFWEQAAEEPHLAESFDAEMDRHARTLGSALAEAYDFSSVRHVTDVGGGTGTVLRCLLDRHPHLRGTIVEYADAAARARHGVEATGMAGRAEVVEASFLEAVPPGADAYLLSWILHDWGDDDATTILLRCREAAPAGGRVLVVEQPFDVTRNTDLDLRMLVFFGGRERTRAEYEALAGKAGLDIEAWRPLRDGMWLMDTRAR